MVAVQRLTSRILLVLAVPVSSFFGLLRPSVEFGAGWIGVWSLNLWADVVFTLGTMLAVYLTAVLMRRARAVAPPLEVFAVGALLSFLLHWGVYVLSWSFAVSLDGEPHGFLAWGVAAGFLVSGWPFILRFGLPGLVVMALLVPAVVVGSHQTSVDEAGETDLLIEPHDDEDDQGRGFS